MYPFLVLPYKDLHDSVLVGDEVLLKNQTDFLQFLYGDLSGNTMNAVHVGIFKKSYVVAFTYCCNEAEPNSRNAGRFLTVGVTFGKSEKYTVYSVHNFFNAFICKLSVVCNIADCDEKWHETVIDKINEEDSLITRMNHALSMNKLPAAHSDIDNNATARCRLPIWIVIPKDTEFDDEDFIWDVIFLCLTKKCKSHFIFNSPPNISTLAGFGKHYTAISTEYCSFLSRFRPKRINLKRTGRSIAFF